jgi:hypothetical protein
MMAAWGDNLLGRKTTRKYLLLVCHASLGCNGWSFPYFSTTLSYLAIPEAFTFQSIYFFILWLEYCTHLRKLSSSSRDAAHRPYRCRASSTPLRPCPTTLPLFPTSPRSPAQTYRIIESILCRCQRMCCWSSMLTILPGALLTRSSPPTGTALRIQPA